MDASRYCWPACTVALSPPSHAEAASARPATGRAIDTLRVSNVSVLLEVRVTDSTRESNSGWLCLSDCTEFLYTLQCTQDHPARSVSFGYSQDNANQQPTSGNYCIFLEAKWQFAWVMSLISTNQTT